MVKRSAVGLICFILMFSLSKGASAAAPQPISVGDFWQRVADTLAWLDVSHTAPEWAVQAANWSQVQAVTLSGGQVAPVDTAEIVNQMRAKTPDPAKLKAYLSALQAARQQWSQGGCGDCKAGLLSQVLARPEFQPAAQSPLQQFLQNILDSITGWFNRLLGGSPGPITISPTLFTITASLLLAALLILIFRDVYRNMARESELAEDMPGGAEPLTARLASQKALELSEGGDYRHAMRYLYLSALLFLDEHALLRYDHSLTNREYLRQVSGQPRLVENLKVVVDDFDRVWYGYQPVNQAEYALYAEKVRELKEIKE